MKKKLTSLLILVLPFALFSQTVLNGDFENHSESECSFNMPNSVFTSSMVDCTAFGPGDEIDIQDVSCEYSEPESGMWFISLASFSVGTHDAVSLKLSEPLIEGHDYQLDYFQKANTEFTVLDSLLIGISTNDSEIGEIIYQTQPVNQEMWESVSITFSSPSDGQYLTFSNAGSNTGWNFIDNVQLSVVSGVDNSWFNNSTSVYPNPSSGKFNVDFPEKVNRVEIYNSIGQVQYFFINDGHERSLNFDFSDFAKGVYFVVFYDGENKRSKKLVLN